MKETKNSLIRQIANTWVLHNWLQEFYLELKKQGRKDEDYLGSIARKQHGMGGTWMGGDNVGSRDCARESFRNITCAMGLKYQTPLKIWLRTSSCLNKNAFVFKGKNKEGTYRVEHTRDVKNLFECWETSKIRNSTRVTPNEMGRWVIEKQIVVLCEAAEQIPLREWDSSKPFSKYSSSVWNVHNNSDVSNYNYEQIQDLNRKVYQKELELVDNHNFARDLRAAEARFCKSKDHFLPDIDDMVRHCELNGDNQSWLLENIYRGKLKKISDPNKRGKNGYNEQLVQQHRDWKGRQVA